MMRSFAFFNRPKKTKVGLESFFSVVARGIALKPCGITKIFLKPIAFKSLLEEFEIVAVGIFL